MWWVIVQGERSAIDTLNTIGQDPTGPGPATTIPVYPPALTPSVVSVVYQASLPVLGLEPTYSLVVSSP